MVWEEKKSCRLLSSGKMAASKLSSSSQGKESLERSIKPIKQPPIYRPSGINAVSPLRGAFRKLHIYVKNTTEKAS